MAHHRSGAAATVLVLAAACSSPPRGDEKAPPAATDSLPIVCTLTPEELARRRDGLLPGLIERAALVEELENGLRLRFPNAKGLLTELIQVVEAERCCCTFLRFQLIAEPGEGPITFEVTGPPGTREFLRSL